MPRTVSKKIRNYRRECWFVLCGSTKSPDVLIGHVTLVANSFVDLKKNVVAFDDFAEDAVLLVQVVEVLAQRDEELRSQPAEARLLTTKIQRNITENQFFLNVSISRMYMLSPTLTIESSPGLVCFSTGTTSAS